MTMHADPTRADRTVDGRAEARIDSARLPNTAPGPAIRAAAGPAAGLVALPDTSHVRFTVPEEVSAHLSEIQAARQGQLEALPSTSLDAVGAAYRASIERILEDVQVARRRLAAGLYGICDGCGDEISVQRLELRAWATTCAPCATRERS